MDFLALSAGAGLLAVFLCTVNMGLGLLMAVGYNPRRRWPRRPVNLFVLHNGTGYLLVACIAAHVLLLLFLSSPSWRLGDLLWPLDSPVQPVENTIGALSLYLVVAVVVTSYFRVSLGRRRWKMFHYLVYAAGIGIFSHGLLANPRLNSDPIDPLDGEKLIVESCFILAAVATGWAWRQRLRKAVRPLPDEGT